MKYMKAWMRLKFGQMRLLTVELAALERLIRSFSYLQVMMTCMRARRSLNFGQIRLLTAELAALEGLKKSP